MGTPLLERPAQNESQEITIDLPGWIAFVLTGKHDHVYWADFLSTGGIVKKRLDNSRSLT
jgi:hypothetical protein